MEHERETHLFHLIERTLRLQESFMSAFTDFANAQQAALNKISADLDAIKASQGASGQPTAEDQAAIDATNQLAQSVQAKADALATPPAPTT
jgi:hypothetical protein